MTCDLSKVAREAAEEFRNLNKNVVIDADVANEMSNDFNNTLSYLNDLYHVKFIGMLIDISKDNNVLFGEFSKRVRYLRYARLEDVNLIVDRMRQEGVDVDNLVFILNTNTLKYITYTTNPEITKNYVIELK